MEEEKLIHVSFQIPPSALDRLSRLAEQLRILMNAASTQTVPDSGAAENERAESDFFELERFQTLQQSADTQPATIGAAVSDIADAEKVFAAVRNELQGIKSASENHPAPHTGAGSSNDSWPAPSETHDVPVPPVKTEPARQIDKIPAVQADADKTVPDAPEAMGDVQQQLLDPESTQAAADARAFALAAIQGVPANRTRPLLNTGSVMQPQPEISPGRWSSTMEELVIPGPAPLTAEAVSLAFERDSRRFDNGFPLY